MRDALAIVASNEDAVASIAAIRIADRTGLDALSAAAFAFLLTGLLLIRP